MKVAIFGSGGVGGYFGGLLAHAGHEVTFIARGEHLTAIRQKGLQVFSVNGDFLIHPAHATDDPAEVGPVDYVIVGVKHYHLETASPQIAPLVGEDTAVVPLLNGVDAHEYLIKALGAKAVVGGLCSLVSMIEAPGVIRQPSKLRRVVVGELDHHPSVRLEKLVDAWRGEGADAIQAEDIHVAMWTKFLFIASFGGVTSLARANAGEILKSPETRQLFIEAMREVDRLARAQGIQLAENAVETALVMAENFEPTTTSSMQRDVADEKLFELEAFNGKIVRLGQELGVETPVHRVIDGLLRPALERAKASIANN